MSASGRWRSSKIDRDDFYEIMIEVYVDPRIRLRSRKMSPLKSQAKLAWLLCAGSLLGVAHCGPPPEAASSPPGPPPPAVPATAPAPVEARSAAPASRWYQPDTNPQPGVGKNFDREVAQLSKMLACGIGKAELPAGIDQGVVGAHCTKLRQAMQGYRDNFLSKAVPFFDKIRPKDLPPSVVYPFGGGDLASALTAFPSGLEYTTISLEFSGDPRPILKQTDKKKLAAALELIQQTTATLLRGDWNWTRNMEESQKEGAPEQLAYALIALVVHNYEPVSLRYFHLNRDGTVKYVDDAYVAANENKRPKRTRSWGPDPAWSPAFSNMEIRFKTIGTEGPVKVYRHIAANLADDYLTTDRAHLTKDPSLLAHLDAKREVSALTRAASHLLWMDGFQLIREYLMKHIVWMPSDSSGLPPPFAQQAGLKQDTYGVFTAAYEPSDQGERRKYNQDFIALFKSNPQVPLDFLWGYPDNAKNAHMVVTYRPDLVQH